MPKALRWLGYILAAILVISVGLYIAFRVLVGGVNFPAGGGQLDRAAMQSQVRVADGFGLQVFAADVPNARVLRFTRAGDLLVAQPNLDSITLLRDRDGDGVAEARSVLLEGLNGPNGMDFLRDGDTDWLYIALNDSIVRVRFDHAAGAAMGEPEALVTGLPVGAAHWKKTLRFGPDGMFYVTIGSSCNVCVEEDERRGTMLRYAPDGSGEFIYARGLRNSAGFAWAPDGELYATDNGRDLLGDNFPPCELNHVVEGGHYGWPYANGDKLADPDFGDGNESTVAGSIAPVFNYAAHNAPLGIEFLTHPSLPQAWQGVAIVALHGSWNRSEKDGYKVVSMHWDEAGRVSQRDFVWGFLHEDHVIGRPAEVAGGPDGSIYISDDYANAVYRVTWGEQGTTVVGQATAPRVDGHAALAAYSDAQRAELTAKGVKAYARYACAACHAGQPGQVPLADLADRYDVMTISAYLKRPTPPMPAHIYDDATLEALAVYLLTL